ncbi:MAG: hypothetical protein P9M13_09775 [Candidatus Ancaeobacter aquaticus]|nr:hypothetical protein [Candidatus Ancaeobacter aquaticus]
MFSRNVIRRKNVAKLLCVGLIFFSFGCAQQRFNIKYDPNIHPKHLKEDAPLVLTIPGLNIPMGGGLIQEYQFGDLFNLLAAEGVPARSLAYDTKDHPLTSVASLGYQDTAIGVTRVTPLLINEVQYENERRKKLGFGAVKEIVLITYSQGAVIGSEIYTRIHILKSEYKIFCRRFGPEWKALQKDPEFVMLMNAIQDFAAIKDIQVQREKDFERDPDLRNLYTRMEKKLQKQAEVFTTYLHDPTKLYPDIVHFEQVRTEKYPKKYPKFSEYAAKCETCREDFAQLKQFFIDYAIFEEVLDIKIRYISLSGSYFGSPEANKGYGFIEAVPILIPFVGRELEQIKQTRLGSPHQIAQLFRLVKFQKEDNYPFRPKDTMFVIGVNGDKGDGLVDQSAGHLADHISTVVGVTEEPSIADGKVQLTYDKLPDLIVVPLPVLHLPKATLFGDQDGSAYMTKTNPVFPFILDFINNDWYKIYEKLRKCDIALSQFMVEVTFKGLTKKAAKVHFKKIGNSPNIRINNEFYNVDSNTIVWSGEFIKDTERMILAGEELYEGYVTIEAGSDPENKLKSHIPVAPGVNTFVKIDLEDKK